MGLIAGAIGLPKPATMMFPEMGWSLRDSWCGRGIRGKDFLQKGTRERRRRFL